MSLTTSKDKRRALEEQPIITKTMNLITSRSSCRSNLEGEHKMHSITVPGQNMLLNNN